MTLTQLDRQAVQQSFERAAADYDHHAVLQHEVESRLLERIEYFELQPSRILDLGCGTGIASHTLQERFPGAQVSGLDWAAAMLRQLKDRKHSSRPPQAVCADMLQLPFAARSFDLVFSSLAIQWCNDLEALFSGLRRVMKPAGLFLFTSFGPDTLFELRTAWSQADDRPHVNLFADMHDVGDQLVAVGFSEPVMDMENIVLEYRDVLSLMRELKAVGAHNMAQGRPPGLTGKGKLKRVLRAYEAFRRGGRYPASYEVIYGAAFGPAEGQPMRTAQGEVATFSVDTLKSSRAGS